MKKLVASTEWRRGKISANLYLDGGLYVVKAYMRPHAELSVGLEEYSFETINARHAVAWYAHVVAHITERVEVGGL
jgi:hypothetical protein